MNGSKNASATASASGSDTKQLHLHANAMRRALRATSSYDQARSAPESRPPAYSWPCTALCIIPAVPAERTAPAVPQSASGITAPVASSTPPHQPYDLLLLGTHVHASAREQAAESGRKSCIFVAVLPHVPPSAQARVEPPPHAHPLFRAPSLRARHGGGANGSQGPPHHHGNRVRVIPSYGEFAAPPASRFEALSDSVRGWAQRLCGKPSRSSRREKSYACITFFSKLWKGVRRPLHAVESWWNREEGAAYLQSSGNDATRLLRHYPRLSSLAENGVSLVEEAWPWTGAASGGAAAPFFGLELVWAESDAEWRAREFGAKAAPFARGASIDDPAAPRRELPIHPSHLCLDPKSGEILLTDHDKHAVYKILPSWIMMQELMHIAEPKHSATISAFDASVLPDAVEPAAPVEDFVLPLPDVLLDLVVGYLGNQVWLLAGETNIKGCRDGSGSDAHFNAPNGVAIHPRTGQVFVTDGHWNSRICSLKPQITTQTTLTTTVSSNGQGGHDAAASSALSPSPAPTRWNVATVPLRDAGSGSSLSTWWSAVRHSGLYARAPALWPLRLPTAPVVLPGAAAPAAALSSNGASYSSDALVLLDEELHILRHIPLASGEISTISGQAGSQGMQDGWAQSAQFLFPQALISLPHPLGGGNAGGGAARVPPRNSSMAARQALLLADTGNDRLCLVNLVSRAEIRQERRKQSMLRRQMRALHRSISSQRRRSSSGHSTPDQSDNEGDPNGRGAASSTEEDDDSSSDESDTDSSAPGAPRDDTGPLVGHVETVRLRGQLPPEYDENFIRAPWSPWSDLAAAAAAANAAAEADSASRSAPQPAASSSTVAASSMSVPAPTLVPLPMPAGTLKQHELAASRYASSAATQATYELSSAVAAASAASSSSSSSSSSGSS